MNVLVRQRTVELLLQDILDRTDDEVNALDRGIDDAELFSNLRKRALEELVVKFDNHALLALGIVNARAPFLDGLVEPRHHFHFSCRNFLVQKVDHLLHRN